MIDTVKMDVEWLGKKVQNSILLQKPRRRLDSKLFMKSLLLRYKTIKYHSHVDPLFEFEQDLDNKMEFW